MIEARYLEIGGSTGFVEIHLPAAHGPAGAGLGTVLCIHTAGQSGVQWRHAARALAARGYRVIVPDLPGHGRSEPAVGGPVTDLVTYGDWLVEVLEVLGVERPYVLGCSIGGKLTLELACRPDTPLAGALAMAADAAPGAVNVNGLRRELEDVAGPSRAERTYLGTLASVGRSVPKETAHLIGLMHKREDPEISSSDLIGWGTHDVRHRLADRTCPIHLVCGVDDPWIDVERVRRRAAGLASSGPAADRRAVTFTALPGIGHYPMEEIADFAGLAAGWIDELRSTAADPEKTEVSA
ncbi:alpha/beta hydrolase [Gordonia desulfuricans]|uniref:Alpha/beta hydrolase n=1 Tax=Gordonia desulfuricans TaxID=89051 RepID=A0A7K3LQ00_9ACTN|nr:alpha/beta hydrolase [Gordonia desulfuricans]NDK90315.1 alpha/beta hydrolase [Gordonia desulfuricans]